MDLKELKETDPTAYSHALNEGFKVDLQRYKRTRTSTKEILAAAAVSDSKNVTSSSTNGSQQHYTQISHTQRGRSRRGHNHKETFTMIPQHNMDAGSSFQCKMVSGIECTFSNGLKN